MIRRYLRRVSELRIEKVLALAVIEDVPAPVVDE